MNIIFFTFKVHKPDIKLQTYGFKDCVYSLKIITVTLIYNKRLLVLKDRTLVTDKTRSLKQYISND